VKKEEKLFSFPVIGMKMKTVEREEKVNISALTKNTSMFTPVLHQFFF